VINIGMQGGAHIGVGGRGVRGFPHCLDIDHLRPVLWIVGTHRLHGNRLCHHIGEQP
jgi:hypothetical protein